MLRESAVLDALTRCSTIAVDKTGTLTTGSLSCEGMLDPMDSASHYLELSGNSHSPMGNTLPCSSKGINECSESS